MSMSRQYPLRYGGGVFLFAVGAAMAVAFFTDISKANQYFGWAGLIGTLGYIVCWRRSVAWHGRPRIYQYLNIVGVIALQVAAFAYLMKAPWFQTLSDYQGQLVVLAVVAVHFMLMYWAFGRWVVWLGLTQIVWLAAALLIPIPVPMVILAFGSVNALYGLIMVLPILGKAPAKT
jgi:hypothetical protein